MQLEKYAYLIANQDNHEEIRQFMNENFLKNESMCQAVGMSESEFAPILADTLVKTLKTPFSVIVRHKERGELAGVLLQSIMNRNDQDDKGFDGFKTEEPSGAIGSILNQLHFAFWNLVPSDVTTVLHREMSSVAKKYQRQGIAVAMANSHVEKERLKAFGIQGFVSETSSLANQTLLKKLGYRTLKEVYFCSQVSSEGAQLIIPKDGTEKVVLNWKEAEFYKP